MKVNIKILQNGAVHSVAAKVDTSLAVILEQQGCGVDLPCGGRGTCLQCRVQAQGLLSPPTQAEQQAFGEFGLAQGWRLACQTRVQGVAQIQLQDSALFEQILTAQEVQVEIPDPMYQNWGAVIDIGTSTLSAQLYGKAGLLQSLSMKNPQTAFGADVISRIERALAKDAVPLAQAVRGALEQMLQSLCVGQGIDTAQLDSVVITGNTVMLYLLSGRSPKSLSCAPFAADHLFGEFVKPNSLFAALRPDAKVYLPACISAFVGADITTAILASGMCDTQETALLVDIGTNGEIALWHEGRLTCCSTAAGPAFEGVGIRMGVYGIPGAVDKVEFENGRIHAHTIGDRPAVGICGSGVVDALAVLLRAEIIDETGAFEGTQSEFIQTKELDGHPAIHLSGDVFFTAQDVREVQLAKGSIRAGMETLCAVAGVQREKIAQLYVAGGFGSYLNLQSAAEIGLLPKELVGRARVIGNAAQSGASMLLQSRPLLARAADLAKNATTIALDANPIFMDNYMQHMLFESS